MRVMRNVSVCCYIILYYINICTRRRGDLRSHEVSDNVKAKNKSDDFSSLFDVILFLCAVFGFKAQFLVENCFSEAN